MTQAEKVLAMLRKGPVRPLQAWHDARCYRLADVIYRLRKKHVIGMRMVPYTTPEGGRIEFAEYVYLGEKV